MVYDKRIVEAYMKNFDLPGWFEVESQVLWAMLLAAQQELGLSGNFLEIGVFCGKSAVLGAMHLQADECCVLVDINIRPEALQGLDRAGCRNIVPLQGTSLNAAYNPALLKLAGTFRWVHVDGDHTGFSTLHDIELGARVLSPEGIICVDDFFSFRYPQLTAAVFRFLFDHPLEWRMFLAGSNKCYLCRAHMYDRYEAELRKRLPAFCEEYRKQANKSSAIADYGCWTVSFKAQERIILGTDHDPNYLPY